MDIIELPDDDLGFATKSDKANTTLPRGKYGEVEELEKALKKDPRITFIGYN